VEVLTSCTNPDAAHIQPAMSEKKVALVTGANKGLGLEIARQLGKQGFTVVMGAREAKAEPAAKALKAEGVDARSLKLDVTNAEDIAALPAYFEKNFGRLDVLINNAGVLLDGGGSGTSSPEKLRATYETNVIAPYAITQALLPLIKKSPAGRIVNHSSVLGSLEMNASEKLGGFNAPGYNSSKAALNMLTVLAANELKGTNVKINAAHPGWVKTDMGGAGAQLEIEDGAKTAVELATLPADGPTGGYFHLGKRLPW
jgi:NAD(P)-dependent dehydrogenase (short-subunit alcohol dehydrogenase family)